jgi:hypothetical protein
MPHVSCFTSAARGGCSQFVNAFRSVIPMLATLLVAGAALTACDANPIALEGDEDVQSIQVLEHDASVAVGQTLQLEAVATNPAGRPVNASINWESLDSKTASVDGDGVVTGIAIGEARIVARVRGDSDTTAVHVVEGDDDDHGSHDPPSDDPSSDEWDNVLENVTFDEDVVVPDGETWLIGANVKIAGNLRTNGGTIAMRPGSSLHFLGANPDDYVGGGMGYEDQFANDIGLWVGHHGVLDIRGTPKTGWNRTGQDATWNADDEYWIAPTDVGDFEPRRWHPGDPVPQVDPRVPATEVMNVTRDVLIEGPGHIHIHSQKPQRIEYVRLEGLGVSREGGPVVGRYALHLHHGGDGTQGTVIRGVAATNSLGRVFVPHGSHGIRMIDNVSVNSWAEALWWDLGDHTNDLFVDRLAVSGVNFPRDVYGGTTRFDAVRLVSGSNMTMQNSVVSGARGNRLSVGWHWNTSQAHRNPAKWEFNEGNVAHNNEGAGIRFWVNERQPHHVSDYVSYRNGEGGVANGAYGNSVRYSDALFLDGDNFSWNSNPLVSNDREHVGGLERVRIEAGNAPAISVGHRRIEADAYLEVIDSELIVAPGQPKILVGESRRFPWKARFIRSGITPDDIVIEHPEADEEQGTHIIIEHEDGRRWEILVKDRKVVVTEG